MLLQKAALQLSNAKLMKVVKDLGLPEKKSRRGLITQMLKAAYRSRSAHAHVWENILGKILTKEALLGITNKDSRQGPQLYEGSARL